MNHLHDVELAKAYRLLNHGPVSLVTFEHAGAGNVMAASWVMPLDFEPPKLLLVLDRNTYSRDLLEGSGAFVINLPARQQAELTLAVGNCTGRGQDKFAQFGITPQRAKVVTAPIVPDCLAYLECRVIDEPGVQQRHDLFVAEVVAAYADARAFSNGRWHFPDDDLRTLHYSAGGTFYPTGNPFKVTMPEGFDE
ncbi:flavin reductase family protein [Pseudomonas sp. N040]|uniref:flavin reductase family protein n=1 Tax=Pseudomonas sp. N040 TaxID=2785325 RepID=UPI0018A2524A|nr:flavin reductase family protein [Pseudomonas sp. N040]MBF7730465.1 flavin reductase family protein [Pseudomonas sp. N040]MBW7014108.1 flavin reductase family protein [Pseudomonas sp. N040]